MGKGKAPRVKLRRGGLRGGIPRWEFDDCPVRRAFVHLGLSPFHWTDQLHTDPGDWPFHQEGLVEPGFDWRTDKAAPRFAEDPIERTQAWAIYMQQTGRMG